MRLLSVLPNQTVIGFDQARDLFSAREILDGDIKIIGPTAGNNPNLHHGVGFLYYLAIPLAIFGPAVMNAVLFNVNLHALLIVVMYFFAKSLYKSSLAGVTAAILTATSYYLISYSGWLSNPTVTLLTVPMFFWMLWEYIKGSNRALIIASFFLGLSIQFELFFVYLLLVTVFILFFFKKHRINLRIGVLSLVAFSLAIATMIATEFKYNFAGIGAILGAGDMVGGSIPLVQRIQEFLPRFADTFGQTLYPKNMNYAPWLVLELLFLSLWRYMKLRKKEKISSEFFFTLIYLFSPATMLLLGSHNAPWFLVALPPAIILLVSFIVAHMKIKWLGIGIVAIVTVLNIQFLLQHRKEGQVLLEPDNAGKMQNQIAAIDYIYSSREDEKFTINTLTNPLYINAVWGYQFDTYGKEKYGSIPTFSGGDQVPPYNVLPKTTGDEELLYLIMDMSPRIPEVHKDALINWAEEISELVESKSFDGIVVEKRKMI